MVTTNFQFSFSFIYRQGSGSACRSLYGGFVKWVMGNVSSSSEVYKDTLFVWTSKSNFNFIFLFLDNSRRRMEVTALQYNFKMRSTGMNLLLLLPWYVPPSPLIYNGFESSKRDFTSLFPSWTKFLSNEEFHTATPFSPLPNHKTTNEQFPTFGPLDGLLSQGTILTCIGRFGFWISIHLFFFFD